MNEKLNAVADTAAFPILLHTLYSTLIHDDTLLISPHLYLLHLTSSLVRK